MARMTIDDTRKFWRCAGSFPIIKEDVYPEHAAASGFDELAKDPDPKLTRVVRALEYGCGAGSDTLSMLRRGHVVTYCDVVPENVQIASMNIERAFPQRVLCQGVLLERTQPLPFGPESFDHINCHGVFHHIELEDERAALMREFHRVLVPGTSSGPGGTLALMLYTEHLWARCKATYCKEHPGADFDEWAFGGMTDGGGCYAKAYDEVEGKVAIEAAGFKVLRATEYNNKDFRTFWVKRS